MNRVIELAMTGVALLYTIISHELAHGYVALLNGDDTAKKRGRLTWNPLAHLDPVGALCLFLFHFGWAKPVPINPYNFRHRISGMITTSLAGVSVNLISAAACIFLLGRIPNPPEWLSYLLQMIALYGVAFCVFNLLPIPPLDGSRIILVFLPREWREWVAQHERIIFLAALALIATGMFDQIIRPLTTRILNGMIRLFYAG
ncbi:MAG: site-2 protease family protein [Ndongobacter sp.]|nr:site-2 protease family protein [Ndongobacter sp.]